jgi:two-component system, LytTR family, response regulator
MKAIVIDDVDNIRANIINLINEYTQGVKVVGQANSIKTGIREIETHNPDVVFLDVELLDGNAFELLNYYDTISFKIVFITSYSQYAIQAFKLSAVDYILKPIDPKELINAINKLKIVVNNEAELIKLKCLKRNTSTLKNTLTSIVLKNQNNTQLVNIEDIVRCEADDNYTRFYLANGQRILISKTLKEHAELLEGNVFFRIHKSHLVNINYVKKIKSILTYAVVMKDGAELPLSVRKHSAFKESVKLFNSKLE